MKPKRKSFLTEEMFRRSNDEFLEKLMEESRQELIPRLRKDNAEKKTKKSVTPIAAGQ
jgi:hypothetical protein